MADILQIFSGNPLSTFIGKKIEAATSLELESDDWGLNLEICDFINENDDDGKDAIRAIRRRLQQVDQDTNFTITNRTLTVLETCVNNCSHRFHVLAMQKEFIQELVKLIGPKNNPPIDLQERVLRMIQKWADAFKLQSDLSGVVTVYNELKSKGVTFPAPDSTSAIGPPVQTPQRTVPPRNVSPRNPTPSSQQRQISTASNQIRSPGGPPVILEGEGYNKITQDLNVVKTSIEMFTDILKVIDRSNSEQSDWDLAADLANTCRKMKERIVELIEQIGNEDLTIELLGFNDQFNNIFMRYDKLLEKRKSQARSDTNAPRSSHQSDQPQASRQQPPTTAINPTPKLPTTTVPTTSSALPRPRHEPTLIDFEESGEEILDPFAPTPKRDAIDKQQQLTSDLNRMSLSNKPTSSGDDPSANAASLPKEISNLKEQDFAEIENWLSSDAGRDATSSMAATSDQATGPTSLASPEFENFIASRALAASSSSSSTTKPSQPKQREPSS